MTPFMLLSYLVVALVALLIWWAAYTIYRGVPAQIQGIIERNYLVLFVFPGWALLCGAVVSAFDAWKENAFNVEYLGLKFEGSGGLAVAWAVATVLGWIILASVWRR
jgi:hypothetical protein